MFKLIRNSVFETNSSSCHSLSIPSEESAVLSGFIPVNEKNQIEVPCMEFGWEQDIHRDSLTKLSYVCLYVRDWCQSDSFKFREILKNVVLTHTGADGLVFDFEEEDGPGYIDHQSVESRDLDYLFSNQGEKLRVFLFSDEAYLETDNDNH